MEELCLSLIDVLTSTSTSFNISEQDKYEFKDFLDKNLLWLHVKNNTSIEEHQKKIDLINEYTNEIMQKYKVNDLLTDNLNNVDILKKELEELCFAIKYTISSDKVMTSTKNLENVIDDVLEWITKLDMEVYINNLKISILKEECNEHNNNIVENYKDEIKDLTDDEKNNVIQYFIDSNNIICNKYQDKINEINILFKNIDQNTNCTWKQGDKGDKHHNNNKNNNKNNKNMGTKINNKNKIDERIADLLLEIDIQSKLNII